MIVERLYQKYKLAEYSLLQSVVECIASNVLEEADRIHSHCDGVFGVHDIIDTIGVYLHSDIEKSLVCGQDDFIRALAILDRRCGKRGFEKYTGWDYTSFPEWLRRIYQIRFEAEDIRYDKHFEIKKVR